MRRFLSALCLFSLLALPASAQVGAWTQSAAWTAAHTRSQTTTWNPSDKNASITLSSGNQLATGGCTWCGVRATTSFTVGTATKRIFTITVTSESGNEWIGGFANAAWALNQYPGESAVSAGWQSDSTNNQYASMATSSAANSAQSITSIGSVAWFAIDFNTGNVWWSSNCISWFKGVAAADPDTGTNPNAVFSGTPTFFPAVSLGTSNSATLNTFPSLTGCGDVSTFVQWDY